MSAVTETYSEQLIRARQFIEQHDRFLVVSHVQPDGDAISSTSAVGYLLKRLDKTFTMVNEDRIPGKFAYLWGSGQIFTVDELESSAPFDCVIAVDCADYSRVGKAERLFSDQVKILNIDHHPTNDFYGAENLIKEDAAATAEILYDLVNEFKLPWDTEMPSASIPES